MHLDNEALHTYLAVLCGCSKLGENLHPMWPSELLLKHHNYTSAEAPFGVQLMEILNIDRDLDAVSLEFSRIGSAENPLQVSHAMSKGLVRTKNLRLQADNGCHVAVSRNARLSWENFEICCWSGEVMLELHNSMGFLRGLRDFLITCRGFNGPTCVELSHALASLGRRVHAGRYGSHDRWWLSTLKDEHARIQFSSLLQCGCQACCDCLRQAGKLVWQEDEFIQA